MSQSNTPARSTLLFRKTLLVGMQCLWFLLIAMFGLSGTLVYSASNTFVQLSANTSSLMGLGTACLGVVFLILVAEWFFFQKLLKGKEVNPESYTQTGLALCGSGLILTLAKSIETLGAVVGLSHHSMELYLIFAIPSLFLLILFRPAKLFAGDKTTSEDGAEEISFGGAEANPLATL